MTWQSVFAAAAPMAKSAGLLGKLGAGASKFASFLPFLGSVFGGSGDGGHADRQLQWNLAKHGVSLRVADAKRAGIHPLAALGINPATASPTYSDGGRDYEKMGQLLSTAIKGDRLQEDEQKARTNLLNAQALYYTRNSIGSPGGLDNMNPQLSEDEKTVTGKIKDTDPKVIEDPRRLPPPAGDGITVGAIMTEDMYQDNDGYWKPRLSKDASEPLESSWFDQFSYIWYRGERVAKSLYYYWNPGFKGASEHRRKLRKLRGMIPEKAEKGYEYRYHPLRGFIKRKIVDGKSYLYDYPYIKQTQFMSRSSGKVRGSIINRPN